MHAKAVFVMVSRASCAGQVFPVLHGGLYQRDVHAHNVCIVASD